MGRICVPCFVYVYFVCSGTFEKMLLCSILEILQGGVKITFNRLLCNVDTIKWNDIVNSQDVVLNTSSFTGFCECVL